MPVTETMATKLPSNYCYCFRSHERRNRIRRPLNLCNRASEIIIDVGADRLAGWLAQKPHPAKRGSLALTWPRECIRGGPRAHRAVAIAARSIIACATLAAQRAPPPSARAQFECRPRAGQLAVARPSAGPGRPASLARKRRPPPPPQPRAPVHPSTSDRQLGTFVAARWAVQAPHSPTRKRPAREGTFQFVPLASYRASTNLLARPLCEPNSRRAHNSSSGLQTASGRPAPLGPKGFVRGPVHAAAPNGGAICTNSAARIERRTSMEARRRNAAIAAAAATAKLDLWVEFAETTEQRSLNGQLNFLHPSNETRMQLGRPRR